MIDLILNKTFYNFEIPTALGIAHSRMLPLNSLSGFLKFILMPFWVYKMTITKGISKLVGGLSYSLPTIKDESCSSTKHMGSSSLERRLQSAECCRWALCMLIHKSAWEVIACISNNLDWVYFDVLLSNKLKGETASLNILIN